MLKTNQNFLKAVFWDYPKLQYHKILSKELKKCTKPGERSFYLWILCRFLERGRVKDVATYFSIEEIKNELAHLRLSPYSAIKWKRLIEVYGNENSRK
jgi:hypothetical protein